MNGMAWTRDVDPTKCKGYILATSSRLYNFILVIQDHIESIGKPILLKGDEALLNGLLAQILSEISTKPSTTFSIQIC